MDRKGGLTKSGYLTFEPFGVSKINRRPTGGQVSEYSISTRVDTSLDSSQKPNGSSTISIPEDY